MKILRKLKLVSILMAFAILAGQLCIVNVNAAQGVEAAPVGTKLSGFRIIDLDRPVAGRDLDFKARVRTNENVTWEIPVIWTDENGNTAYKAEPGKTYYPNFAFFIPAGYQIDPVVYASKIFVKLPDFLIELYGESSVVFASDASLGITYITFTQAVESGVAARAKANEAAIAPAPATANTSTNSDDGKGSSHDSPAPQPAPADPFSRSVRVHCSAGIIKDFANSPEVLEEVVSLIKNKLEPQAVALLKNSFDAYKYAEPTAFGQKLGLYIYNKVGSVDNDPTPKDALAYVSGGYSSGDNSVFHYLMGVDVSSFMTQDDDGKWYFKEDEKVNLDATIVHEMMHAYMYDLTRRGMCDSNDGFPSWFTEGMAVTVENAYQFRSSGLQSLSTANDDLWSEELKRYTEKVTYSVDSIVSMYSSAQTGDNRYQLQYSNDDHNVNSAYVSGYLAVIYLGYLAAERDSLAAPVIDENGNVNIDRIRYGLSSILCMLHEGCSLESVIKNISTSNLASEDINLPRYATVAKFEEKFIQGSDGENEGDIIFYNDGNRAVYGSAKFTEVFLNFLENNSQQGEGLDNTTLANGSVLRQDQNYQSPLDWKSEPAKTLYAMTDEEGAGAYVNSTADDSKAWYHTGGRTKDHFDGEDDEQNAAENDNVVEFPAGGGEAGTGVAASMAPTEGIASSDSSASGSSGSSSSDTSDAGSSSGSSDNAAATVSVVPADTPAAADTPAVTDTPAVAELPAIPGEPMDIINPDMGITDAGQDLIILPTEQDAITPDEIAAASPETISSSDPAPAPESGSSDDSSSSDGGSSSDSSSSDSGDSDSSDSE